MESCCHARARRAGNKGLRSAFLIIFGWLLAGCATPAPGPVVDLAAPGWEVRQGQALWKPDGEKPEIAGDFVLSTHPTGGIYLQFSKTVPIVSARLGGGRWEIEFPPENKRYSGRGNPPKRIVWLQLARAIEGAELPERWQVIHPSKDFLALENGENGERLEVHFQK
jgi:hypothetical protein